MLIGEKFLKGHKWNETVKVSKSKYLQVRNNKQKLFALMRSTEKLRTDWKWWWRSSLTKATNYAKFMQRIYLHLHINKRISFTSIYELHIISSFLMLTIIIIISNYWYDYISKPLLKLLFFCSCSFSHRSSFCQKIFMLWVECSQPLFIFISIFSVQFTSIIRSINIGNSKQQQLEIIFLWFFVHEKFWWRIFCENKIKNLKTKKSDKRKEAMKVLDISQKDCVIIHQIINFHYHHNNKQ